jgi:pyrophosphatase PpaX
MAAMRFPVVLFDFDGTVVDSGEMILASMRHATRSVLGRDVPDEELRAGVGGSGLYAQMHTLAPERVDELVRAYREHNEPLHSSLACCIGMEDVLARLREEGRTLGLVTAKRRASVDLAFARLPLEPLFDVIVTQEDTERHKPDPAPILEALRRLRTRADDAAYVGDSPYDIAAAKAAGVHAIAVTWGAIHPREVLEEHEPDAIVDTAEELLAIL